MGVKVNPMSMEGKRIIVTGAASGIGRETAKLASELGASVFLLDKNGGVLSETADVCGEMATFCVCDLTDENAVRAVLAEEASKHGKFHGLVHSAGVASIVPLKVLSSSEYERVQKINAEAGLMLAKNCSTRKVFDLGRQCSIVYISSVYGMVGSACNAAYAASKAAVIGITKALAVELAQKNIRVNCVVPGFIATSMAGSTESKFDAGHEEAVGKMHLLGWGEAVDIANAILFLLSDASKWTTGSVFPVDGGFTAQ